MTSTDILPKPPMSELRKMVEKTLLDFNDAVERADFSDFYASICVPWQKETTAKELQETFQGFIDRKIDISEISGMDAVFSSRPIIKKELGYYALMLKGYYPTYPNTTKFTLHYIPDEKQWKLSSIRVNTKAD